MASDSDRRSAFVRGALVRSARLAARTLQKRLGIRPKNFALISGAPRSGTTAVGAWLCECRGVAGFMESRILVAVHRFVEQVRRFEDLECVQDDLMAIAQGLAYGYYADRAVFFRKSVLVDKEPLEPVAFPDKRYRAFLDSVRAMIPEAKFLLMMRDPVSAVSSMSQRKWGYSLKDVPAQELPLREHIETWCRASELVLEYADDPNTYICQFGRLVSEPEQESKRICDFLGIPLTKVFEPRPTSVVELAEDEKRLVLSESRTLLEMLAARGISDLQ